MSIVATSVTRAADQTDSSVDRRIRRQTHANVAWYAAHPEEIEERLAELDREWDLERLLELNSSILSLVGLGLGLTRSRYWLLLPLAVQGFFLQHAVQGWCPPLPVLRRLEMRTPAEIEAERTALLALRGDLRRLETGGHA